MDVLNDINLIFKGINTPDTSKVEFKRLLSASKIMFDALNATIGGLMITTLDGEITYVNNSFLRIFKYKDSSEVTGKYFASIWGAGEIDSITDLNAFINLTNGRREEFRIKKDDDTDFFIEATSSLIKNNKGKMVGYVISLMEITKRKKLEIERENLITKLRSALDNIRVLKGFIPICASCKKIRDDAGFWHQVEEYLKSRSEIEFTHSICPDCLKKLYPELSDEEDI